MAHELIIKSPKDTNPRITGVLWGPAKCGKTTFLMSNPGRKLLINYDPDGWTAVQSRDDFDLLDLSIYEPEEIIRFSEKKVGSLIQASDLQPGDTVVVDSLSAYSQDALATAISKGIGASRSFKPTIEAPGLSGYGARTQYVLQLIRTILKVTGQLNLNCWFTSHQDTPNNDASGNFMYQTLMLSDNAINQTGLRVSEIWFLDSNDKKRTLAIRPCRGRKPMGSRMFDQTSAVEFNLRYDPDKPNTQPHAIATWYNNWISTGKKVQVPT